MNYNPEDFKNIKVLVIDDDTFLLDMYALKFTKYGFNVETSLNGRDALNKLESNYIPDIIVCDIVMPTMTGLMFIEELKNKKLAPNAIVIVLSNQGSAEDIEQAQKFNIDGYIIKALNIPSEVVEQIIKIYKQKKA